MWFSELPDQLCEMHRGSLHDLVNLASFIMTIINRSVPRGNHIYLIVLSSELIALADHGTIEVN